MLVRSVVYLENSGGLNGWQTVTSVPSITSFVFSSAVTGGVSGGNVGVLVDDVNPALFSGANLDSRPGSITTGQTASSGQLLPQVAGRSRTFVVGKRAAEVALDGNRYSRALQAYSRHHLTLTCATQSFDQEFLTDNIPLGDMHNEGPPADRANPGQYGYPTIQWSNQGQILIDPQTGIRSARATGPQGTPFTAQSFVTAIDPQSAWTNASGPLTGTGGAASFTGPCASGTCPLFLRADNLTILGGATYTVAQGSSASIEWVTVTVSQASISNPSCSGDDCKIVACLTVNGVSCASSNREVSLTGTPASFTFGTQNLMDLWQSSGSPRITKVDVSKATGTVNYSASSSQITLASGNVFNTNWTAGSMITLAGGQYAIASVQSEKQLTLVNGPTSNLTGAAYSANNFGVMIWKKTGATARVSIGTVTYAYGSTSMPNWSPGASASYCSQNPVTVSGVPGYNCFAGKELFWIASDGSVFNDLGLVQFTQYTDGRWSPGWNCTGNFDPQNGDSWYCMQPLYFDLTRQTIIQVHYNGSHAPYTPGVTLPDCALNKGTQPCLQFTIMQPNKSDSVSQAAPLFNPDYAASGFAPDNWYFDFGSMSNDGDLFVAASDGGQDWKEWLFMYTLGDRSPVGTTSNSMHIVAAASTYRKAPASWCSKHSFFPPDSGWLDVSSNDLTIDGPPNTYTMNLTSAALNKTVGATGGMNACPANPFGVTGQVCTAITVNGPPVRQSDGGVLQNEQVGDVMLIDSEWVRIVAMASTTELTIQRGYNSNPNSHTNTKFTMVCGTVNANTARQMLWNYRNDPYGQNPNWTTILADPTVENGHTFIGDINSVSAGPFPTATDPLCPLSALGPQGICDLVRTGSLSTAPFGPLNEIATNPPFAGKVGVGHPNAVDTHPGPCFNGWCTDGRPFDGNDGGVITLGNATTPFTNVTGQLWKISGAQNQLNRKYLTTFAYVGRHPLVDASGPGSSLGSGAPDSYKYCYALLAGECASGSSAGDVYVNAPYLSTPYCAYPGIAVQSDDTNELCIGDLGAETANLVQFGLTQHDLTGAMIRRLGPNYAKWNQFDVFWNIFTTRSARFAASQVRWLDGVRTEDLVTAVPPVPNVDSVARNTFESVPVSINPPRGWPVASAMVEFGYTEYGDAGNYYCTSRQETCVAAGAAINLTAPFYFEQSEQYTGVPCSSPNGCNIVIPALPQHVLYYRWKYFGASGQVLGLSEAHAVVIP